MLLVQWYGTGRGKTLKFVIMMTRTMTLCFPQDMFF